MVFYPAPGFDILGLIKECYNVFAKCKDANAQFAAAGEVVWAVGNAVATFERNFGDRNHLLNRDQTAQISIMDTLVACKKDVKKLEDMVDAYKGSFWEKLTYSKTGLTGLVSTLIRHLSVITQIYSNLNCRAVGRVELGVNKILASTPDIKFKLIYWDNGSASFLNGEVIAPPFMTVGEFKWEFQMTTNQPRAELWLFHNEALIDDQHALGKLGFGAHDLQTALLFPPQEIMYRIAKQAVPMLTAS